MPNSPLALIDASSLRHDGDVLSFTYTDPFERIQKGLVLRWQGNFYAYRNLCPHWSTPLDEEGGELFSKGANSLICQTHGALFEPHTGECISGPCFGERLKALQVEVLESGQIAVHRSGLSLDTH